MSQSIDPNTIHKIAVLRANALGDFIFVLPALHALRETFPQAEIVYLGKRWHADFVPGHVPDVDRVIVIPPYHGVGEPEDYEPDKDALQRFFTEMKKEDFDVALQMHGGGSNSNPFLKRLGAKYTIGLHADGAEPLDRNVPYVFYQNEIMRMLEVVACLGAKTADIVPHIEVQADDIHEANRTLHMHGVSKPYIVLHPGATDSRRHWPARNFAAVARHFIERGYTAVVTGTPAEAELAEIICRETPQAVQVVGELTMGGLAGLLAGAELCIGNDTGPLHMASTVGTKTVGIYWVGNMITAGHVRESDHRPLISWTIHCPECGAPCVGNLPFDGRSCSHQDSFVADVRPDQVIAAAHELLSGTKQSHPEAQRVMLGR